MRSHKVLARVALALVATSAIAWDPLKGPNSDIADGKMLIAKVEYDKALEAFDRAGVKHRNHPIVWFNRGFVLHATRRFDEAKDEFAKAANALPEAGQRADAAYNAGTSLVDLARVTKKQVDGKDTPVSAADRLKHIERAIFELTKALKATAASVDTKWNLEIALRVEAEIKREIEHEEEEKEKVEEGECLAGTLSFAPGAAMKDDAIKALAGAPEPAEKSPIAQALGFIAGQKTVASDAHRTAVVLVTDGMDTCGGDGATGVDALARMNVPTLVVGFAKGADPTKLNAMQERGRAGWPAASRVYRAVEIAEIKAAVRELAPVVPPDAVRRPTSPPGIDPGRSGVPRDRLPVNVIIAVDRSQSMRHKNKWADGKALAAALLNESWPAGVNVGLLLFPWDDREKEGGECGPAEVVVEPAEKTATKIRDAVAKQKPAEKTALGAAFQRAAAIKDLVPKDAVSKRTVAVVITDGADTCGGKPDESMQALTKLGAQVAVVGFATGGDQPMLAKLTEQGGRTPKPLIAGADEVVLDDAGTIVIILDRSESMARDGRWEKAMQVVEAIVAKYGESTRIGLVGFPWGKPDDNKDDKKDQKKDDKKDQKKDQKKDDPKKDEQKKKEPKQNPADKNVPESAKKQQDAAQKAERPLKLAPMVPPSGRPPSKYTW